MKNNICILHTTSEPDDPVIILIGNVNIALIVDKHASWHTECTEGRDSSADCGAERKSQNSVVAGIHDEPSKANMDQWYTYLHSVELNVLL